MRSVLGVLLAGSAFVGGCSGPRVEGGVVIPAAASARLDVLGAAEVSLSNQGAAGLSVEVGWGAVGTARDELTPGVTRWWSTDGPRWFRIRNAGGRPVAVTYTVRHADVSMTMPAE